MYDLKAELDDVSENNALPKPVLLFPNPQQISMSIRASALIFADEKSKRLLSLIERVAPSNATALIKGETGTGKELVARHIHNLSARREGPFAAINCGAFSETLVESELFGYERGAFTGATNAKKGWFETANGGTLFLDEIGDLPQSTQVKLLRVLQEREVTPIGSRKPVPIDVRLIAATNVNLTEAVKAGRFREDLYYRIKVVPVEIPPLRERTNDILPLVAHFIDVYRQRLQTPKPLVLPETEHALLSYPWPGNIRELENVIHRALLVSNGKFLSPFDLNLPTIQVASQNEARLNIHSADVDLEPQSSGVPDKLDGALQKLFNDSPSDLYEYINRKVILQAFEFCNQNQVQTAKLLGISRNVLRAQLKHFEVI
ncbi:MAG: sigma-54 dependent transcriptional regulator [Methylotenera sp.]|nr:sigma-54 dependent transcriptional regulator [Methylotenera sp.]MDD4926640.1 sigma-54 dependent transcriptional regulator [Methylotenera sp.]NOU40913.1 sigma-54-dependent Fis family transcriptional regulator [Methylotenera sp.]